MSVCHLFGGGLTLPGWSMTSRVLQRSVLHPKGRNGAFLSFIWLVRFCADRELYFSFLSLSHTHTQKENDIWVTTVAHYTCSHEQIVCVYELWNSRQLLGGFLLLFPNLLYSLHACKGWIRTMMLLYLQQAVYCIGYILDVVVIATVATAVIMRAIMGCIHCFYAKRVVDHYHSFPFFLLPHTSPFIPFCVILLKSYIHCCQHASLVNQLNGGGPSATTRLVSPLYLCRHQRYHDLLVIHNEAQEHCLWIVSSSWSCSVAVVIGIHLSSPTRATATSYFCGRWNVSSPTRFDTSVHVFNIGYCILQYKV